MSYPPEPLPALTDASPGTPDAHAGYHTDERAALNTIVAELGTNPKGDAADLTERLAALVGFDATGVYDFDLSTIGYPAGWHLLIGQIGGGSQGIVVRDVGGGGDIASLYVTGDPVAGVWVNGHNLQLAADGELTLNGNPVGGPTMMVTDPTNGDAPATLQTVLDNIAALLP